MEDQYADLAEDYDWLLTEEIRDNSLLLAKFGDLLSAGPGAVDVLDCACGMGWTAIDLARRGSGVSASDGSAAMVAQARQNALRPESSWTSGSVAGTHCPRPGRGGSTWCSASETRWFTRTRTTG